MKSTTRLMRTCIVVAVFAWAGAAAQDNKSHAAAQSRATWSAGVARVEVTPREPIFMKGYGSRTKPSEGVREPLFVKALAMNLSDPSNPVSATNLPFDAAGNLIPARTIPRGAGFGVANNYQAPRSQLQIRFSF